MNYIEFEDTLPKGTYFYGNTIFEQIKNIKKVSHAGTDLEFGTKIIQ